MFYRLRYIFILFFIVHNHCIALPSDTDSLGKISIFTHLSTSNNIKLDSLKQLFKEGKFDKKEHTIIIERNNTFPIFVAVTLPANYTSGDYTIVIEDCFIDKLSYIGEKPGSFALSQTGALYPFKHREIIFPFVAFPIKKEFQKDSTYFFSFQNYYHNSVVPVKVFSKHAFQQYLIKTYLFWGVYIGIIALAIFICLWMIIFNHSLHFTYVFFAIFSNLVWVLLNNGLGFQFLWPNFPEIMQTGRFIAYHFSILFIYICFEVLIHKKGHFKKQMLIQHLFISAMIISIFFGLNPFQLDNSNVWFSIYFYFANFLQLSILLYIIYNLTKEIKKKNINAWFYFLSFLIVFISHIGLILIKYSFIQPIEWIFNLNYIGILIQVITLIVALLLDYVFQKREHSKKMLLAQADERHRIAIDMHDEIGSSLSTIKIISELELQRKDGSISKESIEKIHLKSIQINQKLKEIIWTLQSVNDNLESLIDYVFAYAQSYFDDLHIELNKSAPIVIPEIQIDGIKRRHILLIIKEIFQNIVKHADSKHVFLQIRIVEEELHININDNGKGDPDKWIWGNGLKNIVERMKSIQGTINISKDSGVLYHLIIPL